MQRLIVVVVVHGVVIVHVVVVVVDVVGSVENSREEEEQVEEEQVEQLEQVGFHIRNNRVAAAEEAAADNMQHAYIGRITTERRKQKIQIKIKSNKIRRLMFVTCTVHIFSFFPSFSYKCVCLSVVCLCKLIIVTHLFFFILFFIFFVWFGVHLQSPHNWSLTSSKLAILSVSDSASAWSGCCFSGRCWDADAAGIPVEASAFSVSVSAGGWGGS